MPRRTDDGRRSIVAILGLVLALLVTAAGCGDPLADKLEASGQQPFSDDDPPLVGDATATTGTTAPIDPAAMAKWSFVADVNEMCRSRGAAVTAGVLNNLGTTDAVDALGEVVGLYETMAALIGELTPPPGEEAVVADIVGAFGHVVGLIRPVLDAGGFATEAQRASFLPDVEAALATLGERLVAYGLSACAG